MKQLSHKIRIHLENNLSEKQLNDLERLVDNEIQNHVDSIRNLINTEESSEISTEDPSENASIPMQDDDLDMDVDLEMTKVKSQNYTLTQLTSFTVTKLKEILKEKNLSRTGKKELLVQRIFNSQTNNEISSDEESSEDDEELLNNNLDEIDTDKVITSSDDNSSDGQDESKNDLDDNDDFNMSVSQESDSDNDNSDSV